ncbi:dimethylallyltransferase [Bacterioplanes sanyensis]|uniref:type 1 glutamine amidotransferase domain-containing protein n=1 Tax=Bacterioplanes sanyensis TaxID=1249553 RepID=UPI00167B39C7|nr:type 1 glutamine amidotransferase domain-containing protein [Bacterioplanes sanyensis]GGY37357.1 dimethylallyltransferase [Bacterioplanes sanyensis]
MPNILMVLTSHDQLGDTGAKTGFWIEEFAAPYYVFKDAGCHITLASPAGGQPPIDPNSAADEAQTDATRRFEQDDSAKAELANTRVLADVNASDYDAVFYPGGHGPLWDLTDNAHSIALLEDFLQQSKPVATVCHATCALANVKQDGAYAVTGKAITGFSNSEEALVQLTEVVPFLLEDVLKERGADYQAVGDFQAFAIQDGLLISGQNPASSAPAAEKLLAALSA